MNTAETIARLERIRVYVNQNLFFAEWELDVEALTAAIEDTLAWEHLKSLLDSSAVDHITFSRYGDHDYRMSYLDKDGHPGDWWFVDSTPQSAALAAAKQEGK